MSPKAQEQKKKRVVIVGGGASGMSAAYAFSKHPDLFDVTLYEKASHPGGMATSTDIDAKKYGASYINDGVQGASPVFHNTFALFEGLGFNSSEVGMQISFGKDPKEDFWSNVFPSDVIDKYASDIKKFGRVLKVIKTFEPFFALIPVHVMLRMFGFSKDFGEVIVYNLVALFFGTGNQTPFVSSAILERVFMDPSMKLFEYSPDSFLASIPEMRSFPRLSLLYSSLKTSIESTGNVRVICGREVVSVQRNYKNPETRQTVVKMVSRECEGINNEQDAVGRGKEVVEEFDELILACDADSALKILGKDATWRERRVLGNVKYLWDISVTHSDLEYMEKYYQVTFDDSLKSSKRKDDPEAQEKFSFASENFRPLYFIRSYPEDKAKIEMSFDLTVYQAQFKGESPYGPDGAGYRGERKDAGRSGKVPENEYEGRSVPKGEFPPLENHVFQTIFLDRESSEGLWSRDEIAKDKVVLEKWWKQQSHAWTHYAGTVPWMMFINGRNRTHYAGAWSILNMHEIAVVSGFSAAYRLGADYPFADNEDCKRLFTLYLAASHGVRMRAGDRKGFFA